MGESHSSTWSSRVGVLAGSAEAREVLARLHYLVDHRFRLGLVVGQRCSRRRALEAFRAELVRGHRAGPPPGRKSAGAAARPPAWDRESPVGPGAATGRRQVLLVRAAGMELAQLLHQLAVELGVGAHRSSSVGELWRRVTDGITENRLLGRQTVILLDDVPRAAPACLDHMTRITQLGRPPGSGLTTVLAVSPAHRARLDSSLLGLVDFQLDLAELTPPAGAVEVRSSAAA